MPAEPELNTRVKYLLLNWFPCLISDHQSWAWTQMSPGAWTPPPPLSDASEHQPRKPQSVETSTLVCIWVLVPGPDSLCMLASLCVFMCWSSNSNWSQSSPDTPTIQFCWFYIISVCIQKSIKPWIIICSRWKILYPATSFYRLCMQCSNSRLSPPPKTVLSSFEK